jgi:hypothetical protein
MKRTIGVFSMTPVVALARFALTAKAHVEVPLSNTTVSGLPLKFRKFFVRY